MERRAKLLFPSVLGLVAVLAVVLWLLPASASPGITTRVSVSSAGGQANGRSGVGAISPDGRFVALVSDASNLVSGDTNGHLDVFVHDRQTGATELISVDSLGGQGNDASYDPEISEDGRFVAFNSRASNLVSGDRNVCLTPTSLDCQDIFVHDRWTGVTELVSLDSAGTQANDGSFGAAISADGRFVAFSSDASSLVKGDTNGWRDVFVHDRQTGDTERVSVGSSGAQGNWNSDGAAAISGDGRFVVFDSYASNLAPGDLGTCPVDEPYPVTCQDVFVRDRDTDEDGVFDERGGVSTSMVSVSSAGSQGNESSSVASISGDGRFVVFKSRASNLVPGDTSGDDLFVHDFKTGATERVNADSAGNEAKGEFFTFGADISSDGRYVAFDSFASNLVPGDTNGNWDVFIRDRQSGTTQRVSVDSAGNQVSCPMWPECSTGPAISGDGRFVAFGSLAANLVPGDTNTCDQFRDPGTCPDAFVHDRALPFLTPTPTTAALPKGGNQPYRADGGASVEWLVLVASAALGLGVAGSSVYLLARGRQG